MANDVTVAKPKFSVTLTEDLNMQRDALPRDFNITRFVNNSIALLNGNEPLIKFMKQYGTDRIKMGLIRGAYLGLDAMNGEMMGMPLREAKALEINAWLYQNAGKDYQYVILDDEDYFFPNQQEHLVLTDEEEGLTEQKAQKAICILNS